MADVRIPAAGLPTAQPQPARADRDIRAAQRAFFQAALTAAEAPEPLRQAAAQPTASIETPRSAAPAEQPEPDPRRYRPGSLLDMKV